MRLLLIALLATALAVPAAAVADRGTGDRSPKTLEQRSAKRKKQKLSKAKARARAQALARAKSIATAKTAGATVVAGAELELRGAIASLSPLTVGTLSCAVPAAVSLAGFAVGDFVELECKLVGTDWTLRKIHREDDLSGGDDADEREVKGAIASLSPLTVGTVSCVVPVGVSLAGFAVGDFVELECKLVAGTWTLHKLELEDEHAPASGHSDDGDRDDDHDDDHDDDDHEDDDDDDSRHHDDSDDDD